MESFKRRQEGPQAAGFMGGGANGSYGFPLPQQNAAAFGGGKRQRMGPGAQGGEGDQGAVDGAPPKLLPVCLLVSENIAGALIGKGGSTVREFERSTGARILVQRNTLGPHELAAAKQAAAETAGAAFPQSVDVEKVVTVAGTKEEDIHAGVLRILGLVSTHPGHSGRTMALLLVPQRSVGGIVGQRGKTIEDLSQRSQAQMRVVPGMAAPNGDRALWISAQNDEQVAMAIKLVQQHLQQMLSSGRLVHGDVEFLVSLASVPQPKALRGVKAPGPMNAPMGPGGMPMGAPPAVMPGGFYGPQAAWGAAPGAPMQGAPQPAPVGPQAMPVAPGIGSAAPGMSGCRFVTSVERCGGMGCTSVLCFVIPQRFAAWVVGPQGTHVKAIREDTGAQLQVVDDILGFTAEDARCVARGPHGGPHGEGLDGGDRFCMVSGGVQSLCAAILRLGVPLQDKLQQIHQPLRLLIPVRFVTCLIGSKGSVIREMQNNSGATIQISKGTGGPETGGGASWADQGPGGPRGGPSSATDQHRIVFIEGPIASRLVALALIWQRILGVEYPDLSRGGAPFICVSSLVEDLQQQGHDISMVRVPPPAVMPPQMQQQQPPYGSEEGGGAPYYEGATAAGAAAAAWGAPPPDTMAGGAPPTWGGVEDAGWRGPKEGVPTYEQMEAYFRDFCSRFLSPHELGACGERQTIKLLLSQAQGEALLRREPPNPRFGVPPPTAPLPNALDKISELTGCHVRCFVTQEPIPQGTLGAGPPQQQMVLVFTGSPLANSLAVMLTQARLIQC